MFAGRLKPKLYGLYWKGIGRSLPNAMGPFPVVAVEVPFGLNTQAWSKPVFWVWLESISIPEATAEEIWTGGLFVPEEYAVR